MPNAKELPADAFVASVVDLLISSGQSFTLHDAKKLLKRSVSKLPEGKAKATAQSQLPVLKRLLKKKLLDVIPEPEARGKPATTVGSAQAFVSAVRTGDKLSGLLQARLPAHPELLQRVLSQQEGAIFNKNILHLIASSERPDVGHVIVHACQRYSSQLRQMAEQYVTSRSRQVQRKGSAAANEHALHFAPMADADSGHLAELCEALKSIAALCPLHGLPTNSAHCILNNACQPPASPIATLVFTAAAAHTLAQLQRLPDTWLTVGELRTTLSEVQHHVHGLAAGLHPDPGEVESFLLQHPVTAVERCTPSCPWAAVPCIAWLAVHAAVTIPQLQATPFLGTSTVLLQRRCAQRYACLGDKAAAEKAARALSGRTCSAAACAWVDQLQQPVRLVAACQRQDACNPGKLGEFLLRYPEEDEVEQLLRVLLQCEESAPAAAAADPGQDDDALFVLDAQAEPVFTGAWSASGGSAGEDEGSDEGNESDGEAEQAVDKGESGSGSQ